MSIDLSPPSDPPAEVSDWIEFMREIDQQLLVIAWSDGVFRKTKLRSCASKPESTFAECEQFRSKKQFMQWLASQYGLLSGRRTFPELYGALFDLLLHRDHVLILDEAHRLSTGMLDALRNLHHHMEDECRRNNQFARTTIVLSSGSQDLIDKLDSIDDFWVYCRWKHYDIPWSQKQRQARGV